MSENTTVITDEKLKSLRGDESDLNLSYDMILRQDNGRMFGLILTGGPGIGKTHALMAMVKDDEKLVRIAVAGKAKEDMVTYPVPDKGVDGIWTIHQPITESAIIPLLEENIGDGYGVLLLDDVTGGDPSLQTALLEMVQFGRIGEHKLGKNVLIGMTGNGIEDGAKAVEWNTALMGRCHTVEYKANFDLWANLRENKNLDPVIMGFLHENAEWFAPSMGNSDAIKFYDELNRGPQPRTWTAMGNHLMSAWDGIRNFKPSLLFPNLSSFMTSLVGEKAAGAVMTFAKVMLDYPTAKEMFADPHKWRVLPEVKKNNRGAKYAVAHAVRQYAIQLNDKINDEFGMTGKKAEKEKEKMILQFAHAVASLMEEDRALGAFCVRYFMQKTSANDPCGAIIADMVYDLNGSDPVLRNVGFDKIFDDVKTMGSN